MNEYAQKAASALDRIAAAVFYLLSVLLFPVTLIGYAIWVGKPILTGRGSGVSRTDRLRAQSLQVSLRGRHSQSV